MKDSSSRGSSKATSLSVRQRHVKSCCSDNQLEMWQNTA
jgi:hypothetical protein